MMASLNSIKMSGTATTTCIELHDGPSCEEESIKLRPGYPYLHTLWMFGFNYGRSASYARSVSLCRATCSISSATTNETTITTTTAVAAKPTTKTLGEPVTNKFKLQVNNLQEEEQPSHSLVWAIMLIILAILSILGLAGFGGVYFFQRYRTAHLLSYEERCNFIYRSESENLWSSS